MGGGGGRGGLGGVVSASEFKNKKTLGSIPWRAWREAVFFLRQGRNSYELTCHGAALFSHKRHG